MELSISELADLTGFDRRTVTKKLEKFTWSEGPKGAHLYNSKGALAALYVAESEGKTFAQGAHRTALETAARTRARREEVEKKRPPLDLVLGFLNAAGQEVASLLKVHKGKVLDQDRIDAIFGAFRDLAAKVTKARGGTW